MPKILMFHRVLPLCHINQPNAYSTFGTLVSTDYLKSVLSFLLQKGYHFSNISSLPKYGSEDKIVALTFDDGYSDNFEFALPILKDFKVTATFFPLVETCRNNTVLPLDIYYQCVDEMDLDEKSREEYIKGSTKNNFYWASPNRQMDMLEELFPSKPILHRVRYMSPQQIKELSNLGFEIGSHGMTHSLLTADYMLEQDIAWELEESKNCLENIIGKPVESYCFPSGQYTPNLIESAKDFGYTSVCLIRKKHDAEAALPSYERIFVHESLNIEKILDEWTKGNGY